MKFDAKLSGLYRCLIPAINISSKPLIKDLYETNKVLMKVEGKQLIVYANNGRMYCHSKLSDLTVDGVDFGFSEDGEITVDTNDLSAALASFDPKETLEFVVASGTNELKIIKVNDREEFQTIPIMAQNLTIPDLPDKYNKTLEINRELFVNSINNVYFAIGFEDQVELFLYWILRVAGNCKTRFIAGNKNRFAVSEAEEDSMISSDPATMNILFAKEHTPLLLKTLSNIDDKSITIKQADPKSKNYALVIESKPHTISMSNMAPNAQWPDENKILNYQFTHKVVTKVADWKYAIKASQATFQDGAKDNKPHKITLEFDFNSKTIKVMASDIKKSTRKVDILDSSINAKDVEKSFNCVALYIQEIDKLGHKDGYAQIEYSSPTKPILVRFTKSETVVDALSSENVRSHGYDEKNLMFFAPLGN